jgi:hypothetical protein
LIGRHGVVPYTAEIELENLSNTPLEIEHRMTGLQYLNLVVCDSRGKKVSQGHFGDRFAPAAEKAVLRLVPGEKFTASVHLFATMPDGPIPPGTYVVQAIYEYNGIEAVSEPVEVTV